MRLLTSNGASTLDKRLREEEARTAARKASAALASSNSGRYALCKRPLLRPQVSFMYVRIMPMISSNEEIPRDCSMERDPAAAEKRNLRPAGRHSRGKGNLVLLPRALPFLRRQIDLLQHDCFSFPLRWSSIMTRSHEGARDGISAYSARKYEGHSCSRRASSSCSIFYFSRRALLSRSHGLLPKKR